MFQMENFLEVCLTVIKTKVFKWIRKMGCFKGYNFDYMFLAWINKGYYKDIFKEFKDSNFIKDVIVKKPPPKKTELSSENSKSSSDQSFLLSLGELIFDF